MDFLAALKAELARPEYQGKTDAEAVALLRAPAAALARPRGVVSAYQVVNVLDPAEFSALTAVPLQRLQVLLAPGQVDLRDDNTRQHLAGIFPNPGQGQQSPTRAALVALRTETIPRARDEELFGHPVAEADVATARNPRS